MGECEEGFAEEQHHCAQFGVPANGGKSIKNLTEEEGMSALVSGLLEGTVQKREMWKSERESNQTRTFGVSAGCLPNLCMILYTHRLNSRGRCLAKQVPEIHLHSTSLPISHLLYLAAQLGIKVTIKYSAFSVVISLSVYEDCYAGCRTTCM